MYMIRCLTRRWENIRSIDHAMEKYKVKPLKNLGSFKVEVPGSKSITNRALLLAAMCTGRCTLKGVLFSDDSRAFLSCLKELGFELAVDEDNIKVLKDLSIFNETYNKFLIAIKKYKFNAIIEINKLDAKDFIDAIFE